MSALLPEQIAALEYARRRGTEASVDSIRSRVAGTYAKLEALIEPIPQEIARQHRDTSLWSIQEVIDHLIESERPAIDQLARLLAGEDVDQPIPASLLSAEPLARSWAEVVSDLRAVHAGVLGQLALASTATALTATGAVQMVVKCAQPDGTLRPVSWVERLDWKAYAIVMHAHNREHIAQIQRILGGTPRTISA